MQRETDISRPAPITSPADDLVTTFVYDNGDPNSKGNILSIISPQQNKTTQRPIAMTYDTETTTTPEINDLLSINDPDPNNGAAYMTYYPMGNMQKYTDPLGHYTDFTYNDLHQLVKIKDYQQHETNYTYDHKGNRLSMIDANTKPTYYTYDFNNQLTKITNAYNKDTTLSYSGDGSPSSGTGVDKLTAVKDAKNQETKFEYDNAGNLVKETDPLGKITTYTYDVKNNLKTRTDADGRKIEYNYYLNNRLQNKQYYTGETVTETITYGYDNFGNMTSANNASIAYAMTYDAFNRLKTVTANGRTIEYQYNADGNRTQMKITPDNITYTYAYDDDGNLTTITTPLGDFTFTYDAANRRYTRTAPNGTTSTYSYDTINRLTGIETKQGETTIIDNVNYPQFDNVGNRKAKTKLYPQQESLNYYYDDIYRLKTVKLSDVQVVEDYTYDDVGNRQTSGNEQFPQTNEAVVYSYDHENRLTGVTITQGSNVKQLTFAYDPFGRRIKKTVSPAGGGSGEEITNYVYDGQNIVMEYDQNNNITATYIHGPSIDEPLAVTQGTNTYYYHADGLGSITSLSNAGGSPVQTYTYDSFGNMTASSGISQPYAFTGREYDSETGMYFYRARYYDPKVGRFVTKDPIGFGGGDVNLYNYVGANPVNWGDPSGKLFAPWHTAITFAAAINSGYGLGESLSAAYDSTAVDFRTGSQAIAPESVVQHGMRMPGENDASGVENMNNYINNSNTSVGEAAHSAQDFATPGHGGKEWNGFGWNWETVTHIWGDLFPSWGTINNAYDNTMIIMNRRRNGQSSGSNSSGCL